MRTITEEELEREMLDSIHRTMSSLHRAGVIDDAKMRHFDELCLTPEELDVRALREREGASRADLARLLGVSPETLGRWERGLRRPEGPALRLLTLAQRHGLAHIR